ncbi:MAG: hypothetical protein JWP91_2126 [Fibrobacteres bacterium]|nr:hypothetical protein [Fibrobacterota bacterium]
MINTRNSSVDKPRSAPASKPSADKAGEPARKSPGGPGTPTPTSNQAAALISVPGKIAPKTAAAAASALSAAAPQSKNAKARETGTGQSRSSARREAHTGHAMVMPNGRERGGGGGGSGGGFGSQRDGQHQDMHEWMPFSAQQSRITRTTVPHHLSLPKTGLHAFNGSALKTTVLSMFGKLYMEVLPSIFRRTPQEVTRLNRDIKKDAVHRSEEKKLARNQARRESGRDAQVQAASMEPRRVLAGDLTQAFANA